MEVKVGREPTGVVLKSYDEYMTSLHIATSKPG